MTWTRLGRGAVVLACSLLPVGVPKLASAGPIADVICYQKERMYEKLRGSFHAHRAWAGLRSPDETMELWEDADGEWTLVVAYTDGSACIVAMGTAIWPLARQPQS